MSENNPGMSYTRFSLAVYDEDNDKTHEKQMLSTEIQLNKFLVKYELSSIPVVELHLDVPECNEKYMSLKNVHVIVTTDQAQKVYDFGVIDRVVKYGKSITLIFYGFLCKYEDFMNIESSYLGSSFIQCVKALDVKKSIKINGKNGFSQEFSDDFSKDYWQIQESKVQVLHKILQQASEQSIYTMDNDTIYINKLDFSTDPNQAQYDYQIPSSVEYVSKSEMLSYLLNSDTCIKNLDDSNTELSMNTSFGKFMIDEQSSTAMVNYMKSYPLAIYQGDIMFKYYYQNHLPKVQLGESMKKSDTMVSTNSNLYAIEKIERFSKVEGMTTCILFSAV